MDKAFKLLQVLNVCVLLVVAVVCFAFAFGSDDDVGFVCSDWGCFNESSCVSVISVPTCFNGVWNVAYVIDSTMVFEYFDDNESAWAFYSFLKMTYTGGHDGK